MSTLGPRQALFAQFAVVAKTLGHARRLELLEQLAQGERSVEALADRAGLSVANASQHLQLMMGAGVIGTRRAGKFIYYRLADDGILDALAALRRGRKAKHRRCRSDCPLLLRQARRAGAGLASTASQADERGSGHCSGRSSQRRIRVGTCERRYNIPLHPLKRRLAELNPKQEIVAYCRGEH